MTFRFGVAIAAVVMLWSATATAEEELSVARKPAPPEVVASPLPSGSRPRSVTLSRVGDSLKHGQLWAVLMWGKKCAYDSDGNWNSEKDGFQKDLPSERAFRDELTKLGFVVAGDPNNLFKDEEDDGAELQVGALVTDVSVAVCGGQGPREEKVALDQSHAYGQVQMAVEWQIYSPVESRVVAHIPTVVRLKFDNPIVNISDVMFRRAFAENAKALGAAEGFRAAVLGSGPSIEARRSPAPMSPIVLNTGPMAPKPLAEAPGAVVALFTGDGMGSGFLVSHDGYLLTNRHVVGASKYLKVKWSDGIETIGEVVRSDVGRDIALVKTDPRGRAPLILRRGGVQAGETVFAIGTPLDPRLQGSLTKGVVSANRVLDGYAFIQSDVVVNPGNSGGPLLDEKGAVVGVVVSGVGLNKAPRGINFFIPIGDAIDFLGLTPRT
jgi:serine protease Do